MAVELLHVHSQPTIGAQHYSLRTPRHRHQRSILASPVPGGLHVPAALVRQCLAARHQVLVPINHQRDSRSASLAFISTLPREDKKMTITGEYARVTPDEPTQALWDTRPSS